VGFYNEISSGLVDGWVDGWMKDTLTDK